MSLIGHLRVVSSQIASAESRTLFPVVAEKQSHGLSGPLRDPRALGFSQQCCFPFLLEEETNEASASFPLSNGCSAKAHPLQCLPEHLRREGQWKAWGGGGKDGPGDQRRPDICLPAAKVCLRRCSSSRDTGSLWLEASGSCHTRPLLFQCSETRA